MSEMGGWMRGGLGSPSPAWVGTAPRLGRGAPSHHLIAPGVFGCGTLLVLGGVGGARVVLAIRVRGWGFCLRKEGPATLEMLPLSAGTLCQGN